jgi:hypothetical protein
LALRLSLKIRGAPLLERHDRPSVRPQTVTQNRSAVCARKIRKASRKK